MRPVSIVFIIISILSPHLAQAQSITKGQTVVSPPAMPRDSSGGPARPGGKVYSIIIKLDGSPIQKIVYNDPDKTPLQIFEGDRVKYVANGAADSSDDLKLTGPLLLILKSPSEESRFPLVLDGRRYSIPSVDSPSVPMSVFIENLYQLKGCRIKLTVMPSSREPAKDKPEREAVHASATDKPRAVHKEASVSRLRLRSEPNLNGRIMMHLRKGTRFQVVGETDEWYQIKLPDGSIGWLSRQYVQDMPKNNRSDRK